MNLGEPSLLLLSELVSSPASPPDSSESGVDW